MSCLHWKSFLAWGISLLLLPLASVAHAQVSRDEENRFLADFIWMESEGNRMARGDRFIRLIEDHPWVAGQGQRVYVDWKRIHDGALGRLRELGVTEGLRTFEDAFSFYEKLIKQPFLLPSQVVRYRRDEAFASQVRWAIDNHPRFGLLGTFIQKMDLSLNPMLRELFAPENWSAAVSLGIAPSVLARLFTGYLQSHLRSSQGDVLAKELVRELLAMQAGDRVSPEAITRHAGLLVRHAPVVLQKLLQIVAVDARSPLIRAVMGQAYEGLEPIPSATVDRILKEELKVTDLSEVFSKFERVPTAAATIGEVHYAELRTGEPVAIKIQRPGIREQVNRELSELKGIAAKEGISESVVDRIAQALLRELDFPAEAEAARRGLLYADAGGGIASVEPSESLPPGPRLLALKWVKGLSLAKALSPAGDLERTEEIARTLQAFYRKWADRALFGDGFAHVDPHPGNLFLTETGLSLVDYGSTVELTPREQKALLALATAVFMNSPKGIHAVLAHIGNPSPERRPGLLDEVRAIPKGLGLTERMNQVLMLGIRPGLDIPVNLLSFNRGRTLWERTLEMANRRLAELNNPLRIDPERILFEVVANRITRGVFGCLNALSPPKKLLPSRK